MNTDIKGELAEAAVIKDLILKGFVVLQPFNKCQFDIVAYKDELFVKIQVKYTTPKNGKLEIRLVRTSVNCNGIKTKKYDDIDYIATYNPDTDTVLYINFDEIKNLSTFSIRLEPAVNNQKVGINWWEDYIDLPI